MPATNLPQDLRTFITGSTALTALVSTRVHYNYAPISSARPNIWFRVTNDNQPLTMDGAASIHQANVDIECVGLTESDSQAVADAIKARMHGYKGTMGQITCNGAFMDDKDDDYVPFSNQSDEGAHVVSFNLNLWYTT